MLTLLPDGALFCQKEGRICPVSPERGLPALPVGGAVGAMVLAGVISLVLLFLSAMRHAFVPPRIP